MKNKIQKNNEKNIDQITRSRSIKSRWAVRLLVLLVMLTTILASFVVPASAADPFSGARQLTISNLNSLTIASRPLLFPLSLGDGRFSTEFGTYLNYSINVSNGNLILGYQDMPSTIGYSFGFLNNQTLVSQIPFLVCNYQIAIYTSGDTLVVPANVDILTYIEQNNPGSLNYQVHRIEIVKVNGLDIIIQLDSAQYSIEVEGGIRSVFDLIGSWFSNTFITLGDVFFDNGSLTVLGGLSIGSLGVSVILLLIKVISNFIRFRG